MMQWNCCVATSSRTLDQKASKLLAVWFKLPWKQPSKVLAIDIAPLHLADVGHVTSVLTYTNAHMCLVHYSFAELGICFWKGENQGNHPLGALDFRPAPRRRLVNSVDVFWCLRPFAVSETFGFSSVVWRDLDPLYGRRNWHKHEERSVRKLRS